jgi:hypothetical protein
VIDCPSETLLGLKEDENLFLLSSSRKEWCCCDEEGRETAMRE